MIRSGAGLRLDLEHFITDEFEFSEHAGVVAAFAIV